ncbi:MAG TPA: hypothetical protein VFQ23_05935 [Anaerolineales bacterium]|nr:hypothetical protein [Anaerolineales bacterium]
MQTLNSKPLDDYLKWREVVFSVTGSQVAEITDQPQQVYGVIMDVGLSNDFIISVTAFASGEASLRTTVGGGAIGLGSDPFIAEQAEQIITRAQSLALSARQIHNYNLPTQKEVYFYFLTPAGLKLTKATMEEVGSRAHPFHEMFSRFSAIKARSEELLRSNKP